MRAECARSLWVQKMQEEVDWARLDIRSIQPQEYSVRILMMPRDGDVDVTPYGVKGRYDTWIKVSMMPGPEMAPSASLLAIAPTMEHVGCSITHGNTCCVLFFNPWTDNLILRNDSQHRIYASQLDIIGDLNDVEIYGTFVINPGALQISTRGDGCIAEFKVLPREYLEVTQSLPTKRPAESLAASYKKSRVSTNLSATRTTAMQEVLPGNPLLALSRGEILHVGTGDESYQLKRLAPIAENLNSSVWKGEHSGMPGKAIVVKIIKPASHQKDAIVQALETWLREMSIHSSIRSHFAIVQYLGSDGCFLSTYMEEVGAKSLSKHTQPGTTKFNGNSVRAWRVLADIASGLCHLHGKNIVHGDIKLDNILFDPLRGATLIDFNLSFKTGQPLRGCGTPWYLPPEYLQDYSLFGKASDMWGLGVVTLWLLGHIPKPEKEKGWRIADLHPNGPLQEANIEAQEAMAEWLHVIRGARWDLKKHNEEIAAVVGNLLRENQHCRITSEALVQQMAKFNLRD
ncbi:kinase-like domain-containing protein [Xylaria digitata]|nr:kinase-like domain-containing protein [Xylaria digitata]